MSITVMKQALEALERIDLWLKARYSGIGLVGVELEAITSLRQAIAEAEKQPDYKTLAIQLQQQIAQAEKQEPSYWLGHGLQAYTEKPFDDATPLYTSPQPAAKESLAIQQEQNFCERCGKRLGKNDWDVHTCTPPAEAEKQEPVAWDAHGAFDGMRVPEKSDLSGGWADTSPPQRQPEQEPDDLTIAYMSGVYDGKKQRQPLTDEQIEAIANEYGAGGWICDFARAIEAAHGIKENT